MRTPTVLLMLAAGACTQTVRFPPDLWGGDWYTDGYYYYDYYGYDVGTRTTADTGEGNTVQVARIVGSCDSETGTMAFGAITDGWSGLATFSVFRANDGRFEDHVMKLTDLDPGRSWDRWDVSLTDGAAEKTWLAGTSSAFECGTDLTFAVRLGAVLIPDEPLTTVDCVVWGSSVAAMTADLAARDSDITTFDDCRTIIP